MNKDYNKAEVQNYQARLIENLEWAISKARQIDGRHEGSTLNELREVEMALVFVEGWCKAIRREVQGHSITMPKGS